MILAEMEAARVQPNQSNQGTPSAQGNWSTPQQPVAYSRGGCQLQGRLEFRLIFGGRHPLIPDYRGLWGWGWPFLNLGPFGPLRHCRTGSGNWTPPKAKTNVG